MMREKVAIIGAGACGLVASILFARNNKLVTVYEKSNRAGRKIDATGNGKCNITNSNLDIKHFHSQNISFIEQVLKKFDFQKCRKFFF